MSVIGVKLGKIYKAVLPLIGSCKSKLLLGSAICQKLNLYLINTFAVPLLFYIKNDSGNIYKLKSAGLVSAYLHRIPFSAFFLNGVLVKLVIFINLRKVLKADAPIIGFGHGLLADVNGISRIFFIYSIKLYDNAGRTGFRIVVFPGLIDLDGNDLLFSGVYGSVGADSATTGSRGISGNDDLGQAFRLSVLGNVCV